MHVALFVPCYIDQFYPQVARATLALLEKLGCTVTFSPDQTCCGQPMANAGFADTSRDTMRHFTRTFAPFDYVVAPSGSCVLHVREHYETLAQTDAVQHVRAQIYELCEFLTDVLGIDHLDAAFPHRVGLHASCHGLRGLHLARPSEINAPPFDKVRHLLNLVDGIELVDLARPDECCGFGGTFAVSEEAISVKMGRDRVEDHLAHGAEVITSTDMSCLMHLDGLIRREQRPVRVLHVAEILNGGSA
ncbi:MAG TPA: (Fe-S)-binding protein [Rhodothermales bacterium]|nr:(Fe-S)-binding protein [Rhodothermales bacterium]